jgi:hypothetical protein
MIIGPAVDEAAEYYRLPEWSGISTCPSASKILTDAEEMKASLYDYNTTYLLRIWLRKMAGPSIGLSLKLKIRLKMKTLGISYITNQGWLTVFRHTSKSRIL